MSENEEIAAKLAELSAEVAVTAAEVRTLVNEIREIRAETLARRELAVASLLAARATITECDEILDEIGDGKWK